MPTPYEDLYAAAVAVIDTPTYTTTLAAGPKDHGSDFRITSGTALYQIQITPKENTPRGTVDYPTAEVTFSIHHWSSGSANEKSFLHDTLYAAIAAITDNDLWTAEAGIYSLDLEAEPSISDGARESNVITFDITVSVLTAPV